MCMCMLMCMCMCNVYDQYFTCMAQVSELSCGCCPCPRPGSPSATITFLPCLPGTMLRAPLVSASPTCSPSQCPVQPPPAACKKAQLQTPFFQFLCCPLCFRVADYSRPVAMTDCCCCPSPYWPYKIVQQSTGLIKPLIECIV